MRVKIYQINMDRDADNVKFMGTDARKSLHLKEAVDPSIYDEVFNAEIKETDPEEIYRRFNTECVDCYYLPAPGGCGTAWLQQR